MSVFSNRPFDRFLVLWVPIAMFVFTVFVEDVFGYTCFSGCEDGPIENIQALIMLTAFGVGLRLLQMPRGAYPSWTRVFFAIGVAGSLYAVFEEISYGQRIFGWITPDAWDVINDQQETNLHNTSSWLDQKPRAILEIGVFIGGLLIPALRRWKPEKLPQKWAVIYPDSALWFTAAMAIAVHMGHEVLEGLKMENYYIFHRPSEMQEAYMYWFILLYFISKRREFKASAARGH